MAPLINLEKFNNEGFDRGAGRFKEFLWMLVRAFFFQMPLPVPSSIRRGLLKMFGAKIGRGVIIRSGVNITFPWRLTVGDHVWIGDEVLILSLAEVRIGNHCCISQRAFLCTGSHDFGKESFDLITRPIEVGESCWIAACAFVGPGSNIPAGTMVRAGSVVSAATYEAK